MAGTLVVDTLNKSSGVLATQNGMRGIVKAWVSVNGQNQVIWDSFNVSSVSLISTGLFRVNFTTAMADANYAISASAGGTSSTGGGTRYFCGFSTNTDGYPPTTTNVTVNCGYADTTWLNPSRLTVLVVGN